MVDAVAVADQSLGDAAEIEQRYQSALLRATRETSSASTMPTWPSATSAAMRANPERSANPEPDTPRSSSMTVTCCLAQPSSRAFSTKACWRAVDSRLYSTCLGADR